MSEQPDPEMDEEEELHRFDPQLALADERYEVIGSILYFTSILDYPFF